MSAAIDIACPLLRQLEGLSLLAYPDPLSGGDPWTIGNGCTSMLDGRPVRKGDRLADAAEADALLLHVLGLLQPKLHAMVRVDLAPREEAALLSFQFNLGSSRIAASTLVRELNAGNRQAAADQFLAWDKGHVRGHLVTVPGLARRRKLERAVFLGLVDLTAPPRFVGAPVQVATPPVARPNSIAGRNAAPAAGQSTTDLNDAELARVQQATPSPG